MKLEFHQLDRRHEHLRVRNAQRQRQLLASLATSGQQTPIIAVAVADQPDRYLVIDGYKRIAALEQLGRDTVEAVIWPLNEVQALVLDRSLRWSERESVLEEGWLLAELEQRFGYGLEELARQFDRSVSWVSRRLALVELLPDSVQHQVRTGELSAQVAMKYLVPVARGSLEDCQQMAAACARHKLTSRQAGQLYAAWRQAPPQIRQRLLEQPQLFLKVQREAEPAVASPLQELLRDLEMVAAIAHRANRRLRKMHSEFEQLQEEPSELLRHSLALALQELQRLATRIPEVRPGKEEHVESESTNHDSGTACPGNQQTRDCSGTEHLPFDGPQSPSLELDPSAATLAPGKSYALPPANPGADADLPGKFGAGERGAG
ncbi:MAG: ParB N-terminal domain-containing protein, partial [Acidobacteria bacterium Pan2503]|nr:ParB N-terminal domain-containing protein [Candidatus Acidoferrum panamensis]